MSLCLCLPSPLEHLLTLREVELWLKRDDLIHPEVSGNKWRKLKYWWQAFTASKKTELLTFGGAFSNHLAATAALGKYHGVATHALVRGEEAMDNPTLRYCRDCGMQLQGISRRKYQIKEQPEFLSALQLALPQVMVVPEGGRGPLGARGCREILDEIPNRFDYVALSAGTGTTAAGLLHHPDGTPILVFPALKGGLFLRRAIGQLLLQMEPHFVTKKKWDILPDYHFGGYAKTNDILIDFINNMYQNYSLTLDPVYTAKMMYGIVAEIKKGTFAPGTKIVAIHSGGLQGIAGMNERLKKAHQKTIAYEN